MNFHLFSFITQLLQKNKSAVTQLGSSPVKEQADQKYQPAL